MIYWVLIAFWPFNPPTQVDEFHFSTQAGCLLALNRLGPAADSFKIKCVEQHNAKPL